jgi:hypothetical protein
MPFTRRRPTKASLRASAKGFALRPLRPLFKQARKTKNFADIQQ